MSYFKVNNEIVDRLYSCIEDKDTTYRVNDVKDFIDYIDRILLFENEHKRLCEKIKVMKTLRIERIEYEREPSVQDEVAHILEVIEKTKADVSERISYEEITKLEALEEEIHRDYLYTKDIELLKKIILIKEKCIDKEYNTETRTKTLLTEIPQEINYEYIKHEEGTVEHHEFLKANIPRMQRLRKNMYKYIKLDNEEKSTFKVNQSNTLQDSINIAMATYDNKVFKAISGSNDIKGYCTAPAIEEASFESNKVNKLGKLGIGYNRINDSEKKLLEEIDRQIEEKILSNEGELIIYSKWEPCPSCYFVIEQFCRKHEKINVRVKYDKEYGEM